MDTIQPPTRFLPDLVAPPQDANFVKPTCDNQPMSNYNLPSATEAGPGNYTTQNLQSTQQMLMQTDELMTDCSMSAPDSAIHSSWPPTTPSSATSTVTDYAIAQQCFVQPPPPQPCSPPPPPLPPPPTHQQSQQQQAPINEAPPPPPRRHSLTPQQPPVPSNMSADQIITEMEPLISTETDRIVLTNSVTLLYTLSIHSVRGPEICQAMPTSSGIMNRLYLILNNPEEEDIVIRCYATGNLANISKYDVGRAAILGCNGANLTNQYHLPGPSLGVKSLIASLQSQDSNVIIFAITAIHNLLLDRRHELQEVAKEQLKHGISYIVRLLDNQCNIQNYEFKVIVLDCLQILAYGNRENRLAIKQSHGANLVLRTIEQNFDMPPTEELIETASRLLKSLSACPENKIDIIKSGGISVLTHCIKQANIEILKTCLWTLRNLSDVINDFFSEYVRCINELAERLLHILADYSEDYPDLTTCALGILANLSCNNEAVKQFICECNGIDYLLQTISIALRDSRDFRIVDKELLEPAICALCHLMNQSQSPDLAQEARMNVKCNSLMFQTIVSSRIASEDLTKAIDKLFNLAYQ